MKSLYPTINTQKSFCLITIQIKKKKGEMVMSHDHINIYES